MKSEELIDSLIRDTEEIIQIVNEQFMPLEESALNEKPAEDKWSVLECLDHLNIACRHYVSEIGKKIEIHRNKRPVETWKPGLFGDYIIAGQKPKPDGTIPQKMKTLKIFRPASGLGKDVVEQFLTFQDQLLELLEESRSRNLNKIRVKSALGNLVVFRLGNAFRFVIAHNQRHILQAQNALKDILVPG